MSTLTAWLWRLFVSVRLTITLILCLTAFSITGTLIAQRGTTQVPLEKLYSPTTLKWFVAFGLIDIFHSPVFIFTMLLLAMNLIACSVERLPRIWRQAFWTTPPPVSDPLLKEWTPQEALKRKYIVAHLDAGKVDSVKEAKMAAMLFFQKYFGRYVVLRDRGDQFQIMLEKGKYSRLGVYITHLSLLLIFFGSVIGAAIGFEGGMSIEEGTRSSWIQHVRGTNGGMSYVRENGVPVPGFLNLPFEVECEKFTLETYDGERPKAFRSKLNFFENDIKVASAEIGVNHPFVYKGITFYQASFQEVGVGGANLRVHREKRRRPSAAGEIPESVELVENVRTGELYRIDGDAGFRVLQVEKDLMNLGPAAKVQFYKTRQTAKPEEFWVFQKLPGFDFAHRRGAPFHFVLDAVVPKHATGLSVARDPGAWVVWIGSGILIAALFLALYTFHSRYWVTFTEKNGFVVVGWSNKLFLFESRFEKFLEAFRKEIRS